MPTWASDPLAGRWVILAPERADRPMPPVDAPDDEPCPFCPGNEHLTPPTVATVPRVGGGWQVRVVANRYPAVHHELDPMPRSAGRAVTGAHEVVILSPDHDAPLADLGTRAAVAAVGMIADRVAHHRRVGRAWVQGFVNHGRAAGASLAHPHGQVLGLDVVPEAVRSEVARLRPGACEVCATAGRDELLVAVREGVGAWSAPAPSTPYELLVAPRDHRPELDVEALAQLLGDVLGRIRVVADDPAYNVVLHPPLEADGHAHVHVHLRTVVEGGFELGTGVRINPVLPTDAAGALRGAAG